MGFNSTLVILNDGLNDIENDPKFGRKVSQAIGAFHSQYGGLGLDIASGCHANCASVVSVEHADVTSVLAVGQNYGSILTQTRTGHHTDDDKVHLLRRLADEMGYSLRKKPN